MRPPAPPLSGSLQSRLLGHLGDLGALECLLRPEAARKRAGGLSYRMIMKSKEWYKEANSNTYQVNMAGSSVIFTKDPLVYKEVLGTKQKHFTNGDGFRVVMRHFQPTSMIVVEGEQWNRVRKIATRAIAMQQIDVLPQFVGPTMDKLLANMQAEAKSPTVVLEPEEAFPRATFDIFHKIMYNWDPDTVSGDPENTSLLNDAIKCTGALGARSLLPFEWMWKLPLPENRRVDAARDSLRAKTLAFIERRTKDLQQQQIDAKDLSLLDCMIVAATEGNLTQQELVDQVQTFFFGSFDTTSHSLSLLLNKLAVHQDVQDKLRSELQKTFPGGAQSIQTLDDLEKCTYLTWVFDETQRLVPHAGGVPRTCIEPCTIQGYDILPGDQFVIDHSSASLDEANYPGQKDLDKFRPERFGEVNLNKTVTMPFGFGGRICPGRKIASGELKAITAHALLKWKLTRPPNTPFLMDTALGLSMRKGYGTLIWEPLSKQ